MLAATVAERSTHAQL